jgi:hypothetical protein
MDGIDVQIIEPAPTTFEVWLEDQDGGRLRLPRDHHDVIEIEELAYGRVHSEEVRPLPAGTIRVRVPLDERGILDELVVDERFGLPWVEDVAEQVARRILA